MPRSWPTPCGKEIWADGYFAAAVYRRLPGAARGVNSPVRAYRSVGLTPRFIQRAQGSHVYDVDGRDYLDYVCSWGPMILGHNHPVIREAVEKAVPGRTVLRCPHPPGGGNCRAHGGAGTGH